MSNNTALIANDDSLSLIHCEENTIRAHDFVCGPFIYNQFVIECCTGGRGFIIIDGKEFSIKEGDCYVIIPGSKVAYRTTKDSPRSELTCFARGLEIKRAVELSGITSDAPFAPRSAYGGVCAAIKRILELEGSHSLKSDYMRTAEMYKILSSLVDDKQRVETKSIIKRAEDIIDSSYSESISVESIASEVGLERCYFSVLFRKYTGQTPHAYLTSVRVKRACLLLRSTDLPIAEIAVQVGLEPGGFARLFRREIGVTPGKYRKAALKVQRSE